MPPEKEPKSGLSLQTLLISSLSAVAAAIIVPTFWEKGSLFATALTPVIVAVVSEALSRPAKRITEVAPRVARRTGTGAALRAKQPTGVGARGEGPERVGRWGGSEEDPFGLGAAARPARRFPWKLGIATGLLAAVIGAGVVTASELALFGHSVTHSDRTTSVFGGKEKATATPTVTPQATASATEAPTQEQTPRATETPTSAAPTATPTVSPQATPTTAPTTQATPVPTP